MAIWPNVRGQQVEVRDETTAITTVPSHTWPHHQPMPSYISQMSNNNSQKKGNKSGDIWLCCKMRERIFLLNICMLQDRFRIRITFCPRGLKKDVVYLG
jgi:hypothetical protein